MIITESFRPGIVVNDNEERVCVIVDIAEPADRRVEEKGKAEKTSRLVEKDGMNLGNEESASNVSSPRGCNQRS